MFGAIAADRNFMRTLLVLISLVGITAGYLVVLQVLFGSTTVSNPCLGAVTYQRWFGKVCRIYCDKNRDGVIDAVYRVETYSWARVPAHFKVLEAWESSLLNGRYDIHYYRDSLGALRVESDRTRGGTAGLRGKSAQEREGYASNDLQRPKASKK